MDETAKKKKEKKIILIIILKRNTTRKIQVKIIKKIKKNKERKWRYPPPKEASLKADQAAAGSSHGTYAFYVRKKMEEKWKRNKKIKRLSKKMK